MALIEEEFRQVVLETPEVHTLIGDRLSPVVMKPGETLPAGTYRRTGTRYEIGVDDEPVLEFPSIEVVLWGFEYLQIKTTIVALKDRLRTSETFASRLGFQVIAEEDIFDDGFQHADGLGVPGTRIECQLVSF